MTMANDKAFANIGINRALGIRISPNRLPDVLGIRWDGKVDLFEVPSKTDDVRLLRERMEGVLRKLGSRAGDAEIVNVK